MIYVLQQIRCEHLGVLEDFLKGEGLAYRYIPIYAGEAVPKAPPDMSGLIVLGGPMGVYEEEKYPFLIDEIKLIRDALRRYVPTLGVCLGAQLMAKAAGAEVRRGREKEIGFYPIELTPEGRRDPLFKNLPERLTVFQWHGDTFDIPEGAVRLAASRLFPNQAFRMGVNAYALQFHLEVTREMIGEWINEYAEEITCIKTGAEIEKMEREAESLLPTLHECALSLVKGLFAG